MAEKKKRPDNDAWIRDHFEMIVDRFGGKYPYVFVVDRKVFPVKRGQDIAKLEATLKRKYGNPTGMPVPKPRDFVSILLSRILLPAEPTK